MSANRNEYRFGAIPVILSILILGFLLGYVMHISVPEGKTADACQHECQCPDEK